MFKQFFFAFNIESEASFFCKSKSVKEEEATLG